MEQVFKKMAQPQSTFAVIFALLRDLGTMTITRAKNQHQWEEAVGHFTATLKGLSTGDMRVWDVSPGGDVGPKPKKPGNETPSTLSIETAAKGIGLAGTVHIPWEMWHRLRPLNWPEAHAEAPAQPSSGDVRLVAMADCLVQDGLLSEVTDGRKPNARAFPKAKLAEKGALIVNMTTVNDRCMKSQHRLCLPTMKSLAAYMQDSATAERQVFFCKLDINNMFLLGSEDRDQQGLHVKGCNLPKSKGCVANPPTCGTIPP